MGRVYRARLLYPVLFMAAAALLSYFPSRHTFFSSYRRIRMALTRPDYCSVDGAKL